MTKKFGSNNSDLANVVQEIDNQRQLGKTNSSTPAVPRFSGRRSLLHVYANNNGELMIEFHHKVVCDDEEAFRIALRHILHQYLYWSSDVNDKSKRSSCSSVTPVRKGGRVKQNRGHPSFPLGPKRSLSNAVTSPEKRLKTSSLYPLESATNPYTVQQLTTETATNEQGLADARNEAGSEEDDEEAQGLEEHLHALKVDNTDKVNEYYIEALTSLGQILLKDLLKAWIRLLEPRKQWSYPYIGINSARDRRAESGQQAVDNENPGEFTAPPWWPKQDGWRNGTGCRHKEPDHLYKPERLFLSPKILMFTGSELFPDLTVQDLKDSTEFIEMSQTQSEILSEIYDAREKQQQYEEGSIDGDSLVRKLKAQSKAWPAKDNKKTTPKKSGIEVEVNRERHGSSASTEQLTAAQTPASRCGNVYSSFSSTASPTTIKNEYGLLHANYTGPLLQFGTTFPNEAISSPEEQIPPDATAELTNIIAPYGQLPSVESALGHNDQSILEPSSYPGMNNGLPSQKPVVRFEHDQYRRPASVVYEPSLSCSAWPARSDPWNGFEHPRVSKFRQPRTSIGKPPDIPRIDFMSPVYHPHGQPAHMQRELCAMPQCPLSHPHDGRTAEAQQQICSAFPYNNNPRTHPESFADQETQIQNLQVFDNCNFGNLQVAYAQGCDASASF